MADENGHHNGKKGKIPMWGYLAAGGAVILYMLYKSRSNSNASSSLNPALVGAPTLGYNSIPSTGITDGTNNVDLTPMLTQMSSIQQQMMGMQTQLNTIVGTGSSTAGNGIGQTTSTTSVSGTFNPFTPLNNQTVTTTQANGTTQMVNITQSSNVAVATNPALQSFINFNPKTGNYTTTTTKTGRNKQGLTGYDQAVMQNGGGYYNSHFYTAKQYAANGYKWTNIQQSSTKLNKSTVAAQSATNAAKSKTSTSTVITAHKASQNTVSIKVGQAAKVMTNSAYKSTFKTGKAKAY